MPVSNSPIFPQSPYYGVGQPGTGLTGMTVVGTTGLTAVGAAAGTNGVRIDTITIEATVTTTAGQVRIWMYAGSGNAMLLYSIPVPANTVAAGTPPFEYTFSPDNLFLPSGYSLYASTYNSEAFNVHVFGGTF